MEFIYKKLEDLNLNHDLYALGISMGANSLIKYCGSRPDQAKFKAINIWGNPFDVHTAINLMRDSPFEKYIA
jgi:predicted alpha/beta-fold hydrolase